MVESSHARLTPKTAVTDASRRISLKLHFGEDWRNSADKVVSAKSPKQFADM